MSAIPSRVKCAGLEGGHKELTGWSKGACSMERLRHGDSVGSAAVMVLCRQDGSDQIVGQEKPPRVEIIVEGGHLTATIGSPDSKRIVHIDNLRCR